MDIGNKIKTIIYSGIISAQLLACGPTAEKYQGNLGVKPVSFPAGMNKYTYDNSTTPKLVFDKYKILKSQGEYPISLDRFLEEVDNADYVDDNHISKIGLSKWSANR